MRLLRPTPLVVAAILATLGSCTRTVTFENSETRRMIDGIEFEDVPEQLRVGAGAFGVSLLPLGGGLQVSLPIFFADVHDDLVVERVTVLEPVRAVAPIADPHVWIPFEVAAGPGALRVAQVPSEATRAIIEDEGDIVVELSLRVLGETRTVRLKCRRIVRWYGPTA